VYNAVDQTTSLREAGGSAISATYAGASHGVTYNFFSSGYVRDITDRNANKITFAYTYDAASAQYFMASMTDTQGRVTTFQRAGEHQVTKATDPAGRVHTYAYTTISGEPVLASYTDPSGATPATSTSRRVFSPR
jgi:YD repeat-containing protein